MRYLQDILLAALDGALKEGEKIVKKYRNEAYDPFSHIPNDVCASRTALIEGGPKYECKKQYGHEGPHQDGNVLWQKAK